MLHALLSPSMAYGGERNPSLSFAPSQCSQPSLLVSCFLQDDGPDALEEVTNNNQLPAGKKLRSDDPNHKSSEQIRSVQSKGPAD